MNDAFWADLELQHEDPSTLCGSLFEVRKAEFTAVGVAGVVRTVRETVGAFDSSCEQQQVGV